MAEFNKEGRKKVEAAIREFEKDVGRSMTTLYGKMSLYGDDFSIPGQQVRAQDKALDKILQIRDWRIIPIKAHNRMGRPVKSHIRTLLPAMRRR